MKWHFAIRLHLLIDRWTGGSIEWGKCFISHYPQSSNTRFKGDYCDRLKRNGCSVSMWCEVKLACFQALSKFVNFSLSIFSSQLHRFKSIRITFIIELIVKCGKVSCANVRWIGRFSFCFIRFGLVWLIGDTQIGPKLWCSISYSSNIENVHILQIVVFSHLKMKNFFFKSKMCHLFGCPCWCRFSSMHCWQFVVVGLHYSLFELCIPKHCVASYVFFYSAV